MRGPAAIRAQVLVMAEQGADQIPVAVRRAILGALHVHHREQVRPARLPLLVPRILLVRRPALRAGARTKQNIYVQNKKSNSLYGLLFFCH